MNAPNAALRKTAWARSHRRRDALVEGAEVVANAQRYDLIGMLGRQAVRICAISAVSGDPAHGSSEPARVLVERLVDDAKQHGATSSSRRNRRGLPSKVSRIGRPNAERASGKLNDKTAAPRRRAKRSFMGTELPCELIERTQL